ncbi:carboxylesterase family domain-containing protein [Ditylenchus destructor]|uniref:Carboxylesterase family domain-containing protein n=1 Tax=Ditylenchus destructor TaxID=166010 RepID=A0AAD4R660_9BILA|nr:carboxylesterase family domain-containing protein [Ditylenchus destructor]
MFLSHRDEFFANSSIFWFIFSPLFLKFALFTDGQSLEKSRSVWVEQGLVRGKIYKIGEQQVQIFRGIPYAEPPIGNLRFKKPVKKARWEREYSATEYGAPCVQFMEFHKHDRYAGINMKQESEDCLFLNIFSPYNSEDESQLFPILVWIHGGSFLAGSSDTGIDMEVVAQNIVFKNVTLITVNYRLGPYGFMSINYGSGGSSSTSSGGSSSGSGRNMPKIEGNFGIWDMKLALEWVQRNIKQFNGDPSRVTIMGESAGAAAASVLALSPSTKNLVHQCIAMSGSFTSGWAYHFCFIFCSISLLFMAEYMRCNKVISDADLEETLSHESTAERTRKRDHCNLQDTVPDCLVNGGNMNTEEMLTCFRNEVNFTSPLFRRALASELGVSKMIVDGELILEAGPDFVEKNAHVPFLTGVARREWAHKKPEYYQFYRYTNLTLPQVEEAVRKVIESAYVARLPVKVSNSTIDLISNATFLRYMEDVDFKVYDMPGVVTRLQDCVLFKAYMRAGQSNLFVYSFDYFPRGTLVEEEKRFYSMFGDNTVSINRKDSSTHGFKLDAFHGLDHAFIFTQGKATFLLLFKYIFVGYSSNFHIDPFSKRDKAMSRMLTRMIANFAIKGNPSTENFTWPAFTSESAHYVSLNIPPRVIRGAVHFPAPSFWNHEVAMLSKYTMLESKSNDKDVSELTMEERIQLNAYRRAWYVLWLFVGIVALLIWLLIICFVCHKGHSPTSKTYDNIIVNR